MNRKAMSCIIKSGIKVVENSGVIKCLLKNIPNLPILVSP